MRPVLLLSWLSLVGACQPPSRSGTTTLPSSSSPAVAPLVSIAAARARTNEPASGVEWTTRTEHLGVATCQQPFAVPAVTHPRLLAESVTAWVAGEIVAARSRLSDAAECQLPEIQPSVDVHRVRGFVSVSFWAPEPTDTKFSFPKRMTFALRTGKPLSHVVSGANRDLLFAHLAPRFRTTMERWLRVPDVNPECRAVLDQYSPSLDDFTVTERGFSFSAWASLPMWARACYPQTELVFTVEELEPFLDPEVLAAWREE